MSNNRTKLIAFALVGACSFGAWKLGSALLFEAQGTKHAVNRIWIDHMPRDDRDMITHFVLLDHPQGKFGALGRSSQWRHIVDVFRWQLDGGKLGLFFPQDRVRGEIEIETWECAGEAPAPFELCMKMTNKQGRSWTLYSREDWEIKPRSIAESFADIVDEEPTLAAVLGTVDENAAAQLGALDLDDAQDWGELRGLMP
ncbi:MAG: hypothetical protein R6X02_05470 [Enhygromyxa sp.]